MHFLSVIFTLITLSTFAGISAYAGQAGGAGDAAPVDNSELKSQKTFQNPDYTDEDPSTRIKDITQIQNIRDNHLVGYGLVVGLNGTGDTLSSSPQTQESLISMLERLGVNVRDGSMTGKNVAAVMVTATLPAMSRSGSRLDVSVSAIGDAKDLRGGTLLVTPLLGADSNVYAVAQGNISVSGITAQGANASQTKGVPTAGKIANGALIEKEIGYELKDLKDLKLTLNTPDFETSKRITNAINSYAKDKSWGAEIATPLDHGTIRIDGPKSVKPFDLLREIGQLSIQPDMKAKVLIDTQNDIIVITNGVKMSPCAIASGSTTVKIIEIPEVYMPNLPNGGIVPVVNTVVGVSTDKLASKAQKLTETTTAQAIQMKTLIETQSKEISAIQNDRGLDSTAKSNKITETQSRHTMQLKQLELFFTQQIQLINQQQDISSNNANVSNGTAPVVTSQTKISVKEEKGKFNLVSSGATLDKFTNALNQLGIPVREVGSILRLIKNAGGLHAEIVMS